MKRTKEELKAIVDPIAFKKTARQKIRNIKDIEDDLVDQKQLLQFMANGLAGLWFSLPQDIKDENPYKNNFEVFSQIVFDSKLRLDLESDVIAKITQIINDESKFANIVKDEYLDKV